MPASPGRGTTPPCAGYRTGRLTGAASGVMNADLIPLVSSGDFGDCSFTTLWLEPAAHEAIGVIISKTPVSAL
jgi:hypothetical protein